MSSSPQKFSDPANGTVKNVTGLPTDGVNPHDKHPTWYRPEGKPLTDLRVLNSLTETTEPFVAIGGRVVKWYTCGPTVYDMSHMGHARAYLTFDILRRIMEDYFGYSIEYQMNITDIDDKIIKRARVNKLVADFTAEAAKRSFDEVRADVTIALDAQKASVEKRAAALAVPLPDTATGRDREERADNLKVLDLRKEQHAEARARAAAAEKEKNASALIAAASAPLGDWLDSEKGSTITDHEIFNAHARRYEAEYFEDMRRLGVRDPDVISRVTEVVPQVVSFTRKIIDNGFAYVGESSVFFDTEAFTAAGHKYPKNHPTNQTEKNATTADEMAEGEGTLSSTKAGEKKSANDFALWKFSKPGEPAWPSPWGPGRPGWHIECSVMASEVLGDNMDIHGGGCDLKFPHHDNELAQSEAFWGHHQWVNYFFHCGHLHIAGLKMSKSLKNFITIRQALEMMSARQMRILFLQNSWHSSMNFSDQSVGVAKEFERQLRNFFGRVGMLTRGNHLLQEQGFIDQDAELNRNITKTDKEIHDALCDNFDTPRVMAAIGKLMESATQYLDSKQRASTTLVKKAALLITKTLKVFGVIGGFDDIGITSEGSADGNSARADKIVDALVAYREDIRNAFRTKTLDQVMALSDKVRDELLPPLGIRLEDKPNAPTTWKNDDPQVLMRELEEKKAALAAAKRQKIVNELEKQERNLAKWEDYVAPPEAYFATSKAFAGKTLTFDEKGIPSSVDGQPVDAKVAKKLEQEINQYRKSHDELQKKGGAEWVGQLRHTVADLKAQLQAMP